jgi:hypothetical protein
MVDTAMSRTKLPDRRLNQTLVVDVLIDNNSWRLLLTVGFEVVVHPSTRGPVKYHYPREVFCADFKAGTSLHAIVTDACILYSRLLQHGDDPVALRESMCTPPSLIGQIAKAVEGPWTWEDGV